MGLISHRHLIHPVEGNNLEASIIAQPDQPPCFCIPRLPSRYYWNVIRLQPNSLWDIYIYIFWNHLGYVHQEASCHRPLGSWRSLVIAAISAASFRTSAIRIFQVVWEERFGGAAATTTTTIKEEDCQRLSAIPTLFSTSKSTSFAWLPISWWSKTVRLFRSPWTKITSALSQTSSTAGCNSLSSPVPWPIYLCADHLANLLMDYLSGSTTVLWPKFQAAALHSTSRKTRAYLRHSKRSQ